MLPRFSVSFDCLLAAFACEQDLEIFHPDKKEQAFVNSEMEDGHDVCMRSRKGCGAISGLVVKLAKSLYGLKQAGASGMRN